jgi:hypothetical protein
LIVKEVQRQIPAGPPVVLRQEGQRAATPAVLVYRQEPPRAPAQIPEQVVEVEGAPVPPPARRVVVEKFPDQPTKPQNILIEKWLPYPPQRRRVVFQRSCVPPPPNPRNLIIEWQQPCVEVEKKCVDLGVVDADPEEYRRRYGEELKQANEIPDLCPTCPPRQPTPAPAVIVPVQQCGCQQQQQQVSAVVEQQASPVPEQRAASRAASRAGGDLELEGEVEALRRVDLEAAGLADYARFL